MNNLLVVVVAASLFTTPALADGKADKEKAEKVEKEKAKANKEKAEKDKAAAAAREKMEKEKAEVRDQAERHRHHRHGREDEPRHATTPPAKATAPAAAVSPAPTTPTAAAPKESMAPAKLTPPAPTAMPAKPAARATLATPAPVTPVAPATAPVVAAPPPPVTIPAAVTTPAKPSIMPTDVPGGPPPPQNVQVWEPGCDPATKTLSFKVTWDPAVLGGKPWTKYSLYGSGCPSLPKIVSCCQAIVTGCPPGNHTAMIRADYSDIQPSVRSVEVNSWASSRTSNIVYIAADPACK